MFPYEPVSVSQLESGSASSRTSETMEEPWNYRDASEHERQGQGHRSLPPLPLCLTLPPSHSPEACLPLFKHFLIICNFVEGIKDKGNPEGGWIYI